ncbi:hypothetical protein R3Q06_19105 [Rhodococcus erythropolis]|uniref:hypothetical protein n=1 Tax=Rhodococcus erythropolis TaxID=1833 RepID=UPI002949ADDA|nr:hypothetical protein [Rhodococcus erythropolis]MDV6275608.1 hypothetical protein [Rhodococcus erythropolis]
MINTDHWTERWPDHPVIRTFNPPRAGITVRVTDAGGTNLVYIDMLMTADAITEVPWGS